MTQMWQQKLERVEAAKLTKDNADQLAAWTGGVRNNVPTVNEDVVIVTFESFGERTTAMEGDYIVKHTDGRFYAGSAEQFETMYEPISSAISPGEAHRQTQDQSKGNKK